MVQDLELSEYVTMHESGRFKETSTVSSGSEQSERRLFRIGICVLGLLCILQAALNITLRLAFQSKEGVAEFSFNSSVLENLCQAEQLQQNSTQQCSCCNNLLRWLLKEHEALKRQRDLMNDMMGQLSSSCTTASGDFTSGSGDYAEYEYGYE